MADPGISGKSLCNGHIYVFHDNSTFLPHDAAMLGCQRGLGRCNSVRPSVTRVLCDKIKQFTADILLLHERAITSFLTPTVVGGRHPLPYEICA